MKTPMKKLLFLLLLPCLAFAAEWQQLEINSGQSKKTLMVEVVKNDADRAQGLMGRKEMPEGQGMLFVFPQLVQSPFWMKNTLIPLSIGFLDENGTLLQVLDMEPCGKEPCPLYVPEVAYRYAIEVPQGWFKANGIEKGAKIALPPL